MYEPRYDPTEVMKIFSPGQKIPKQWAKFLSCGQNKENLLQFLFEYWCRSAVDVIDDVTIIVGHGNECHALRQNQMKTHIEVVAIQSLFTNQEEADTRLLLHSVFAGRSSDHVVINSPDTDVFVLCIAFCQEIDAKLYFHTGKGKYKRTIDVQQIFKHFGKDMCSALVGFHCFSGCDSVSALYGMGKAKAAKILMASEDHCSTFEKLGSAFEIPANLYAGLEKFTCELYGQINCQDVNQARCQMFKSGRCVEKCLPPNRDSLHKHIQRANYQAAIHKRCLEAMPNIPSPTEHGWKADGDDLVVDWMDLPPAPASVMELSHCSCKKMQCSQRRCSCLANKLPCTDLCSCVGCENRSVSAEESENLEIDDSDSEDEIDL